MAGASKLLSGRGLIINLFKNNNNNRVIIKQTLYPAHVSIIRTQFFCYKSNVPVAFRQLNPKQIVPKLLSYTHKLGIAFSKKFFFRGPEQDPRKRRVPKLLLIQNPFKWLMVKIDFLVLKSVWDKTFLEKEFKFGTKQAISRVTQLISVGQISELNGLLTKAAKNSLLRELERNWSDQRQRALLALTRDDIQISAPSKVHFIRIAEKKYCDVDMAFLAVKWVPINAKDTLIFTEIFARFHREYTPHCIPEWTIAFFKVTRFQILKR